MLSFYIVLLIVCLCSFATLGELWLWKKISVFFITIFHWVLYKFLKATLAFELSSSINDYISKLNEIDESVRFDKCEVVFVNENTIESELKNGKVIVRLGGRKSEKERMYYKAIKCFVERDLLLKFSKHLSRPTAEAVQLMSVKNSIKDKYQYAIEYFNDDYDNTDPETKYTFKKIEQINLNFLYDTALLSELKQFGAIVYTQTPDVQHHKQVDEYVDFLFDIASREPEDLTRLKFSRSDIKVGVILIANQEKYEEQGIKPYLRRLFIYKSLGMNRVYLLGRDHVSADNSKSHRQIIEEISNYIKENLFHCTTIKNRFYNDRSVVTTIVAFDLTRGNYQQYVEQRLNEKAILNDTITVTVIDIMDDALRVSYLGKSFYMSKDQVTSLDVNSMNSYFHLGDELLPKVYKDVQGFKLMNAGTETDPAKEIYSILNKPLACYVSQVIKNNQGVLLGYQLKNVTVNHACFLPVKYTHYDFRQRQVYGVNSQFSVIPFKYDTCYENYTCREEGYSNPWDIYEDSVINGREESVEVISINNNWIHAILNNGMRCSIQSNGFRKSSDKSTVLSHKVGDHIDVHIIGINRDREVLTGALVNTE